MKEFGSGVTIITSYVCTWGHIEYLGLYRDAPQELENKGNGFALLFLCKLNSWEEQSHLQERQICSYVCRV